ncbi:hypothetical protein DFH08DRAFT_1089183 [Mycena albidolilacea]|uniref:F-box domain-containing protein n=1 Tax=Mycena albidolilacea TaxID=1033008 RepID=A0AAD6Z236_9AGAR|nr:hypothetical protein DFH08DRAFT_1089183 [Mycena albidolilacea]
MASGIPPELFEVIVEQLSDSPKDLSVCNLVCREWLLLARNYTTIHLSTQNISGVLDLLEFPTTTLFYSLRRLDIFAWYSEDTAHLPILQMLPQFKRLPALVMWCPFPDGLPDLPWLTELELSGTFGSWASFVRFMSNLPALQTLVLDDVRWADVPVPPLNFPFLDLRALSLDFGTGAPIEAIMLPNRTRSLTLGLWGYSSSPTGCLQIVPTYLHHLGGHLRYLHLRCESTDHIDFCHNVGLQHLQIGGAIPLNIVGELSVVDVSPSLECLLANVASHCSLQTLTLGVQTESVTNPIYPTEWTVFPKFVQFMDAPQFSAVREIQFIVNGSPFVLRGSARAAREHFERLLPDILPARAARRVACFDGEDPDEVWY